MGHLGRRSGLGSSGGGGGSGGSGNVPNPPPGAGLQLWSTGSGLNDFQWQAGPLYGGALTGLVNPIPTGSTASWATAVAATACQIGLGAYDGETKTFVIGFGAAAGTQTFTIQSIAGGVPTANIYSATNGGIPTSSVSIAGVGARITLNWIAAANGGDGGWFT